MIVIVCIDDNNGMMFNNRRQSQDAILREDILALARDGQLRMNAYSKKQFPGESPVRIQADFLEKAEPGDFCFVEDRDIGPYEDRIEKLILYRWNRKYPADTFFTLDLREWRLEESVEFAGSSHEKITREIYVR